ncbi:hypothetical protein CRYUN_Cryun10bG0063900 [Craigia yunnanensis]
MAAFHWKEQESSCDPRSTRLQQRERKFLKNDWAEIKCGMEKKDFGAFPCFRTCHIAEQAVADALQSEQAITEKIKACLNIDSDPVTFIQVKLDLSLLEGIDDVTDFCVKLAKEESVIILPGLLVGLKNWLRLSFALDQASLEDGLGRLKSFCQRHARQY